MATTITMKNGTASAVYDDRWRPILEALGTIKVQRATDVEFDDASGDWIATRLTTGEVIARGKDRSACIAQEVAFLENELS